MSARYSALQIPLRSGWVLDLRGKNAGVDCVETEGLPEGWKGCRDDQGPIGFRRLARRPAVTLAETVPLIWEIFHPAPEGPLPTVEPNALFQLGTRPGTPPRGEFSGVNQLGLVELVVRIGSERQRLPFEIVSTKLSHEQDFERMTRDIASKCQQLLMEWNTPSGVPFTSDPDRRKRLLLEQFLFLQQALGDGRLERWLEAIRNNPHSQLEREASWRPAGLARSVDFLRRPMAMCRDWRRQDSGVIPGEVLDVRKREDRDTPPNRFLRHALESFDAVCREVVRLNPPDGGPARSAALELSARITAALGGAFFREISAPQRLALENQTLQKREGYRDVLRVWLLLEQAGRLDWDGREDVFTATVRNVAALYEYWLFFELLEVLRGLPHMREVRWVGEDADAVSVAIGSPGHSMHGVVDRRDPPLAFEGPHAEGNGRATNGSRPQRRASAVLPVFCEQEGRLKINLRRGKASLLILEQRPPDAEPMRVHFYFDRCYSPTKDVLASGAYSRPFRPDFSIVVFPASFAKALEKRPLEAEALAEAEGRIAYLHFDAKYRVDQLPDLFGPADPGDETALAEEEDSKATNTYKRADLFKMHAYNDAIRRTVGSYVLYPGSEQARFQKYHEILPGVGAFSVAPADGARRHEELSGFLSEALKLHQDGFSQLTKIGAYTHAMVCTR